MHNARITECPHCNTAFRVSDAQLRAAKGAVRCGSCLEVFLAHQHWLSEDDNNDNSAELELDEWGDDPNAIFAELEQLDRDLESSLDDESWALKLLEEEGEFETPTNNTRTSSAHTSNAQTDYEKKITATSSQPAFIVLNEDHEEIDSTLIADEINDAIELPSQSDRPNAVEQSTASADTSTHDDNNIYINDSMYHDESFDPLADENKNRNNEPQLNNDLDWDDLDDSDATVSSRQQVKKSRSGKASYFIIALGLFCFGAQYIFFHLNELSQDPQWRPLLQNTCEQLGCTIPAWRQFNAMRHDDLIVRSHPQQANALLINVRLTNASPFPQAFPILEMRFSDINGNEIGSRHFKPEEYLAGELSGLKLMPAQQPVQIELAIVDPGKDAVNYQLQLLENH